MVEHYGMAQWLEHYGVAGDQSQSLPLQAEGSGSLADGAVIRTG